MSLSLQLSGHQSVGIETRKIQCEVTQPLDTAQPCPKRALTAPAGDTLGWLGARAGRVLASSYKPLFAIS